MAPNESGTTAGSDRVDWIAPATNDRSFTHYVEAVWSGKWVVILAVVATFAGALIYLAKAQKVYQAHSQLLVTPQPTSTGTAGLGLVQQSSDPLRDVETFAGFVTTTSVADRVRRDLGLKSSAQTLLTQIQVTPIAESDIVDIAASENSPTLAARVANAFATATITDRTADLYATLDLLIPRLKAQIGGLGSGQGAAKSALGGQLATLETLRSGPDPSMQLEASANAPTSPTSPKKTLTLAAALVGGLVLGVGLVFLIQLLDPRLRREEELRERFRLPILARVPKASRKRRSARHGPIAPRAVTPEATDAYRSLRSVLSNTKSPGGGRIVLVTGPSPLDGKTTTSINLAAALATSGERVMLIEGDIRRPSIGGALNIKAPEGLEGVLYGHFTLEDALVDQVVPTAADAPHLRVLLANPNGSAAQPLSPSAFQGILTAARSISDWVVIDAPPLIYAPDLLSASQLLDQVVIVVRLGNTNVRNLDETAEMLAHHGIRPIGFVVVGTTGHPQYY